MKLKHVWTLEKDSGEEFTLVAEGKHGSAVIVLHHDDQMSDVFKDVIEEDRRLAGEDQTPEDHANRIVTEWASRYPAWVIGANVTDAREQPEFAELVRDLAQAMRDRE